MAIDSLRKRASIASLGLAFLGPSVIPDGSLIAADRQVVGNSYYGIAASSAAVKTIGDTSQLEVFTASGGLDVGRNLGATSQLEVFTSSGGITVVVPETIGATSQLNPFTSSGGIQVGDVAVEVQTGGGYVPPKYVKSKLKKKDESILEAVYELVATLEEAPGEPPEQLEKRVQKTVKRAEKLLYIEDSAKKRQEMRNTIAQVERLEVVVKKHIKSVQQDEKDAINALLMVI